ncbi:MAG: peptidylprolyl isomerase [Elusimicrobia bacterium]|nr:peptidylprolyl isomerase [Elusimicrobiota bacterium]
MKIINSAAAALAAAAMAAPALAKELDGLAAKVNNEPVLMSEYNKTKDALIEQYRAMMPDFFFQKDADAQIDKATLDKLIDEAILRQKAENLKIKVYPRELENGLNEIKTRFSKDEAGTPLSQENADSAFRDELKKEGITLEEFSARIKKQLMVRKLVDDVVRPKVKMPSEGDVKKYFDNINFVLKDDTASLKGMDEDALQDLKAVSQRFRELTAERVRLRHILIKLEAAPTLAEKTAALTRAEEIKKELDGGLDFEDAAQKYSQDPESAKKGGDLGYALKGLLPKELESKAFTMNVGEISSPVASKFGYHILRLDEKRAQQKLNYDIVKDDLGQIIAQGNFAKAMVDYLKDLRKDAKIEIFLENKKPQAAN